MLPGHCKVGSTQVNSTWVIYNRKTSLLRHVMEDRRSLGEHETEETSKKCHHSAVCGVVPSQCCVWSGAITVLCVEWRHHSAVCGMAPSQCCMWSGAITVLYVEWCHHSAVCGMAPSQCCMWSGAITVLYVEWRHHSAVCGVVPSQCCMWSDASPLTWLQVSWISW